MYNGHKNWNHWNVSLWINNDEGLYRWAYDLVRRHGRKQATDLMLDELWANGTYKTPDGAPYSKSSVYHALEGMTS